jgi:hypothetical protein
MLELTKHQNNVGLVLQEGSRIINSGTINQEEDIEIRRQMKLLNDMWESLRLKAVDRQAKLHERLMKLQNEQLNQMDEWLKSAEARINKINQLADSIEGLIEQKDELSNLQDDLVKEQEAVDCLKQIIVVVDDTTDDQAFTDLENRLSSLSDRWSNVCKFVGNRWYTVQDLILKLQSIDSDFNDLNQWIGNKSLQLAFLIKKTQPLVVKNSLNVSAIAASNEQSAEVEEHKQQEIFDNDIEFTSSIQLIKILKEIELEMQAMHSKLNDMNDIGEQIGTQLSQSPQLSQSINNKMDILEAKWNALLEQMEYLSKVCTEQQQYEIAQQKKQTAAAVATKSGNDDQQQQQQQARLVKTSTAAQMSTSTSNITKTQTTTSTTTMITTEKDSDVTFLHQAKKQRLALGDDEIKSYNNIEPFISQLNNVLESVKGLLKVEDFSHASSEQAQEAIKVIYWFNTNYFTLVTLTILFSQSV